MNLTRKSIKKSGILALSLLAFYLFMRFLSPIFLPIIFALLLSSVFKIPTNFLKKKFRVPKSLTSALFVLLLLLVSSGFLFSAGVKIFAEVDTFIVFLKGLG
ncbi:MAG: AI-2E family transporter, partial [Clostridia bacterium]|nr:AI-2E family transporter [Clostridia bacterium]